MKKATLILTLCIFTHCVLAQVNENRPCTNFNRIEVSGALKVILTEGQAYSVSVLTDKDYQSKVITEVDDRILKIYSKSENGFFNLFNNDSHYETIVYVTTTSLNSIIISGASSIKNTNTLTGDKLDLKASGASEIRLTLKTANLKIKNSGASAVKLKGTAGIVNADISGASSLAAYNLSANSVTVGVTGASSAKVNASEVLTVSASGASEVNYIGTPKEKNTEASGASSVRYVNTGVVE